MPVTYPLVLLHALPLDARMWAAQIQALGRDGTVLAPDLPGFGSAAPAQASVDVWARDVAAALRARGLTKAVFAGCSMGGYVALACLRTDPDLVAGIALIGSRAAADSEAQRAARLSVIQRINSEGAGPWAGEFVQRALSPSTVDRKPDVVDAVRRIAASQPAASIMAAQRALAERPDSTGLWVKGPRFEKLIIHGNDDNFVPLDEATALANESATDVVVVRDAGHLAPMEQPARVSAAIGELWLRCGPSG